MYGKRGVDHSLNLCTDIKKLLIITVLQTITRYCRVFQGVTWYYRVLQSFTGYYTALHRY